MIIQRGAANGRFFVITMDQHTALSGAFAASFGNARFAPVAPRELLLYVIAHHDKGWVDLDAAPGTDPATGLPYNLVETPMADIVPTSIASPDFNERHHPYCGLISSMHSWGLYNGRYGLSDKVLLDQVPAAQRPLVQHMLDHEFARQQRLRAALAQDPAAAAWVEESHLFQNYKQLQFFDTLALYFNRVAEGTREATVFEHVPFDAAHDTEVALRPAGPGEYAMDPYPFGDAPVEFGFEGRYIEAGPTGTPVDWGSRLAATPVERQRFLLRAA
jgi:hypothetical protein